MGLLVHLHCVSDAHGEPPGGAVDILLDDGALEREALGLNPLAGLGDLAAIEVDVVLVHEHHKAGCMERALREPP